MIGFISHGMLNSESLEDQIPRFPGRQSSDRNDNPPVTRTQILASAPVEENHTHLKRNLPPQPSRMANAVLLAARRHQLVATADATLAILANMSVRCTKK
jgi:hypothetical protein